MRRRVMLAVAGFLAVRHPAPPASALVLWTGAGGRSVCDAVRITDTESKLAVDFGTGYAGGAASS